MGDMADWINEQPPDDDGSYPCHRCNGSGKDGRTKCPSCDGSGYAAARAALAGKGK